MISGIIFPPFKQAEKSNRDLKVNFILSNLLFNDLNVKGELLNNYARWKFVTPPKRNANFAWISSSLANREIDTVQVTGELLTLAKKISEADFRDPVYLTFQLNLIIPG